MAVNQERKVGRPRKGMRGLDLPLIIEKAWKVVDERGLAALSTRALAAELDVQSPALYWYFKSKEDLLSLMMENLLHSSMSDSSDGMAWREWIKHVARRQRNLFLSHRDSSLVASIAKPSEKLRTELFPKMLQPMIDAGIPPKQASSAAGAIASMVLGWVHYEQREETRQFVEAFHSSNEGFEFALDALVCGISSKVVIPAEPAKPV